MKTVVDCHESHALGIGANRRPAAKTPPAFLVIPALCVAILTLLPLVYLCIRVLGSSHSFWPLLMRVQTWRVLMNTVALAGTVSISAVAIATPLAWLTVRSDLPGRRLWTVLTVLPLSVPSVVGASAFIATFGYGGIVHEVVSRIPALTYSPRMEGFAGSWAVLTLLTYPYVLLNVRGSLMGMDPSLEEAGKMLGLTAGQSAFRVVLPQLRPAIISGALLVALYTMSDFAAVALMRFDSFTRVIFLHYSASFSREYASFLALMLVSLAGIVVALESWNKGRARYYRVGVGARRRLTTVPLGRLKWLALVFCFVVVALAVGVPALVNVIWLSRGIARGETVLIRYSAALNSVYASSLASLAGISAAIPVAILAARYRSRLVVVLEKAAYAGYALPGVVVALSLVFFAANYVRPLYQTLPLLIAAYLVLFLPQALGTLRSSLLQVAPSIEDAALTLGCTRLRATREVLLPLVKPGILMGAALLFLTTMKELPATLLLGPIGFRTLATEIWTASHEAFYARAAVPGLIMMVMSSLSIGAILAKGPHDYRRPGSTNAKVVIKW